MIQGHGDDGWKYHVNIRADFSSNVLYGPLDAGLRAHLTDGLGAVTHYPEAGAGSLQVAAAEAYGVSPEEVLVTNGATEAIYLIAQAFRSLKATVFVPTFVEYEDACRIQGMEVELREWGGALPSEGLVFLCNPNNPTGATVSLDRLGDYPDTLFVVDESYIEFTRSVESVLRFGYSNVLVLRSLTKSCRIPGLRVGLVIGPAALIGRVGAVKMPWSVNRLALEAGLYVLGHFQDFAVPAERLLAETAAWRSAIRAATGWRVWDSDTHYFLIETPEPLKMRLLEEHGLLVRDASNFRGLGLNIIRVACQAPEHNRLLTEALRECAGTGH